MSTCEVFEPTPDQCRDMVLKELREAIGYFDAGVPCAHDVVHAMSSLETAQIYLRGML